MVQVHRQQYCLKPKSGLYGRSMCVCKKIYIYRVGLVQLVCLICVVTLVGSIVLGQLFCFSCLHNLICKEGLFVWLVRMVWFLSFIVLAVLVWLLCWFGCFSSFSRFD